MYGIKYPISTYLVSIYEQETEIHKMEDEAWMESVWIVLSTKLFNLFEKLSVLIKWTKIGGFVPWKVIIFLQNIL